MIDFHTTPLKGILCIILLFTLNGCGPRYTKRHITHVLRPDRETIRAQDSGINLKIHRLTKKEAHVLFDNRGSSLYFGRDPLYVLHIQIINTCNHALYIEREDITVPLVDEQAIAHRLHSSTCGRVITVTTVSIATAALMFFGAAYITLCGVMASIPALIKTGYAALGVSGVFFFGAPYWATVQARHSWQANEMISNDIEEKGMKESIYIEAGSTHHVLIFVRQKDYREAITFHFHDINSGKIMPVTALLKQEEQ